MVKNYKKKIFFEFQFKILTRSQISNDNIVYILSVYMRLTYKIMLRIVVEENRGGRHTCTRSNTNKASNHALNSSNYGGLIEEYDI